MRGKNSITFKNQSNDEEKQTQVSTNATRLTCEQCKIRVYFKY